MLRRVCLSVVVALAALAGTAGAAGYPDNGKIIFRNYSGQQVVVGNLGVDNDIVMNPLRGKAVFRGANVFTEYAFGIDADGDGLSDKDFTLNLNGNKKVTLTVGDFGLQGLLAGP